MTVRLDLRPDKLDEAGERILKASKALCLFSFCFFALSLLIFSVVSARAFYTAKTAADFSVTNKIYEDRLASADYELKALSAENRRAGEDLDFLLGGAPLAEFLDDVAECLNDEISVESVEISRLAVLIKGEAATDGGVLSFAQKLARSRCVGSVGVPAITSAESGEVKIFSLDVRLRDIRDFLLYSFGARGGRFGWISA